MLAAVVVGAFSAVRWYDNNSYFVRAHNNELVIYQGRIGGFLWYHPVVVQRTGVTTADVPAPYVTSLKAGVEETSVANARAYVNNLKAAQRSTQTTTPPPTTTTTTTTTTTVPWRRPRTDHRPSAGGTDGEADPPTRRLHGALLRGPVPPAEQHPGAQGQLAGQQPQQPQGDPGRADPDPRRDPVLRRHGAGLVRRLRPRRLLQVPAGLPPPPPSSSPRSSGSTRRSTGTSGVEASYNSTSPPTTAAGQRCGTC